MPVETTTLKDYALQQRVMAHMLPTSRELNLTIAQHKRLCEAVIELLGVELLVLVDDVFSELTERQPQEH